MNECHRYIFGLLGYEMCFQADFNVITLFRRQKSSLGESAAWVPVSFWYRRLQTNMGKNICSLWKNIWSKKGALTVNLLGEGLLVLPDGVNLLPDPVYLPLSLEVVLGKVRDPGLQLLDLCQRDQDVLACDIRIFETRATKEIPCCGG